MQRSHRSRAHPTDDCIDRKRGFASKNYAIPYKFLKNTAFKSEG